MNRSITGNGVRETLKIIQAHLPDLKIHEIPSGTQVFDWVIPDEWNVRSAWIKDSSGKLIADFSKHNLHLMGYSEPTDLSMDLDELSKHLYSLPSQPDAIPYVTSYYERRWGFCLKHNERDNLRKGQYHVYIDSELKPGYLTYGELILPGETKDEIFISTYICHPSLANNELSGPCVTTYLAEWLQTLANRKYTYRIIFVPETIGSIAYLSLHLQKLKQNMFAGFNINCVGDDRAYSYLPSRMGNSNADLVGLHVLKHLAPNFRKYTFCDRGSDERQYCAPGVDLPVVSLMRTRYGDYPEYHTSLDDLNLITPTGLAGGYEIHKRSIEILESNVIPNSLILGEPQMGRRGLRPTTGEKSSFDEMQRLMMNLWVYSDGTKSLLEIAEILNAPFWDILPIYLMLKNHNIVK